MTYVRKCEMEYKVLQVLIQVYHEGTMSPYLCFRNYSIFHLFQHFSGKYNKLLTSMILY